MSKRSTYLAAILAAAGASIVASAMAMGHSLFPETTWGDVISGTIIGILTGIAVAALLHARHGPIS